VHEKPEQLERNSRKKFRRVNPAQERGDVLTARMGKTSVTRKNFKEKGESRFAILNAHHMKRRSVGTIRVHRRNAREKEIIWLTYTFKRPREKIQRTVGGNRLESIKEDLN